MAKNSQLCFYVRKLIFSRIRILDQNPLSNRPIRQIPPSSSLPHCLSCTSTYVSSLSIDPGLFPLFFDGGRSPASQKGRGEGRQRRIGTFFTPSSSSLHFPFSERENRGPTSEIKNVLLLQFHSLQTLGHGSVFNLSELLLKSCVRV